MKRGFSYLQYYWKRLNKNALPYLQKLAEAGDTEAQYRLARFYATGTETEEDDEEALYWFEKAAENGHVKAQLKTAMRYWEGGCTERNYTKAEYWLRKAAENGNKEAAYRLGEFYLERDEGSYEHYVKAFKWFERAARQKHPKAMERVGDLYKDGLGVKTDKRKALVWYKKAAWRQNAEAEFKIGMMYWEGNGVILNKEEAFRWIKSAAKKGHLEAIKRVALMYYFGEGTKWSRDKAYYWINKAYKRQPDETVEFWRNEIKTTDPWELVLKNVNVKITFNTGQPGDKNGEKEQEPEKQDEKNIKWWRPDDETLKEIRKLTAFVDMVASMPEVTELQKEIAGKIKKYLSDFRHPENIPSFAVMLSLGEEEDEVLYATQDKHEYTGEVYSRHWWLIYEDRQLTVESSAYVDVEAPLSIEDEEYYYLAVFRMEENEEDEQVYLPEPIDVFLEDARNYKEWEQKGLIEKEIEIEID